MAQLVVTVVLSMLFIEVGLRMFTNWSLSRIWRFAFRNDEEGQTSESEAESVPHVEDEFEARLRRRQEELHRAEGDLATTQEAIVVTEATTEVAGRVTAKQAELATAEEGLREADQGLDEIHQDRPDDDGEED